MKPSIHIIVFFMIILATLLLISGDNLEETYMAPQMPDPSIKCGSCPCGNPCDSQPQLPPPSPPPPPPPEPCPSPPPPPPPPPEPCPSPPPPPLPPVTQCCHPVVIPKPPPPPRFIYVTNPPTNVYHPFTLQIYSGGGGSRFGVIGWIMVVGCVVLEWLLL